MKYSLDPLIKFISCIHQAPRKPEKKLNKGQKINHINNHDDKLRGQKRIRNRGNVFFFVHVCTRTTVVYRALNMYSNAIMYFQCGQFLYFFYHLHSKYNRSSL